MSVRIAKEMRGVLDAHDQSWRNCPPLDKAYSENLAGAMGFLGSIISAAQNWTDSLQTMVPGYRDRIAHIYLDREQGGLNLRMAAPAINEIANYGESAAEKLIDRFVRGVDNGRLTDMTWKIIAGFVTGLRWPCLGSFYLDSTPLLSIRREAMLAIFP